VTTPDQHHTIKETASHQNAVQKCSHNAEVSHQQGSPSTQRKLFASMHLHQQEIRKHF
jgi:hypothetical protein